MINKNNVVVKRNTFKHLAPSGRGRHEVPGEGVLNKEHFMGTPSSPLWGTSPARGEVNGAFTLIELLVVVLIIGILAAVAVPQYKVAVQKAQLTKLIPLVDALYKAEEVYYLANGTYTANLSLLDLTLDTTDNCELITQTKTGYYDCDNFRLGVWDGPDNAQVQIRKNDSALIAYIRYFADNSSATATKGDIACFAKDTTNFQVCKSLGAKTEFPDKSNSWPYQYFLSK